MEEYRFKRSSMRNEDGAVTWVSFIIKRRRCSVQVRT